jgi:hypothetical protein
VRTSGEGKGRPAAINDHNGGLFSRNGEREWGGNGGEEDGEGVVVSGAGERKGCGRAPGHGGGSRWKKVRLTGGPRLAVI